MEKEKLYLYNTLTRKKEVFKPITKGKVGLYSCGPTVYSYPHIGNMRAYVFVDILKRALLYNGLKVKHVMNVTDVGHLTSDSDSGEDKMERAALKEHKNAKDIANFYLKVFMSDLKKLNILEPDLMPKATEHIKEQIALIKKLEKKGYTYLTDDGIYFNSSKFKRYGDFARLNLRELEAGKRVSMGEKKHASDFALWKFSPEGEKRQQEWSAFGKVGFPGWHIECSAMSMKYLGSYFDVHTGGEDHIAVHHTNEIAQSEAATGKKFVNYWLHSAFLTFKGEKVSKSKGGLYTISELEEQGYKPEHFRYLCLLTHYRKHLDFSLEHLDAAKAAFERIKRKVAELQSKKAKGANHSESYEKTFLQAINDDLNMPEAVQVFLKVIDDGTFDSKKKLTLLQKFDFVLGLGINNMRDEKLVISHEIKQLMQEREAARKEKDWDKADALRKKIKAHGFDIEDTPSGVVLRKV